MTTNGWMPIETAPTDHANFVVGCWHKYGSDEPEWLVKQAELWSGKAIFPNYYTHWTPLPDPPTT